MAAELVTPSPLPPVNAVQNPLPTSSKPLVIGDIPPAGASVDQPPHFFNSVDQLRGFSTALTVFLRRYDELHGHLEFIRTSIDAKSPQHLDSDPSLALPLAIVPFTGNQPGDVSINVPSPKETVPITKTQSPDPTADEIEATHKTLLPESTVNEPIQIKEEDDMSNSLLSEVETLCQTSSGKGLKKYILSHLSDANKVREEVSAALKLSPKPPNVVLAGFGRFYITGSRAYTEGSPLVKSRQASLLLLECFMVMGYDPNEIDDGVKKEAESAAEAWKKRLIGEGGLARAPTMEVRGLLLLIGCYGIPSSFDNRDVRELVQGSKAKEISDVLRKSKVLETRISEIIEEMTKKKMEVEAVNMVYIFGLEKKFPARDILGSFLRDSKETWKQLKKGQDVNKANRRHLADLKSVIKCLQGHKIDPAKLLPGWQIKQKMASLERDIADADKKVAAEQVTPSSKRKADEPESSSKHVQSQEVKRARFNDLGRQSPRASPYLDGFSGRDLSSGFPGYLSSFPASASIQHPYDVVGHGGLRPNGPSREVAFEESLRYSTRLAGDASSSYRERLIGQSYMDSAARGISGDIYRSVSSVEGFAGLLNPSSMSVSSRRPASDLYQFADTIL